VLPALLVCHIFGLVFWVSGLLVTSMALTRHTQETSEDVKQALVGMFPEVAPATIGQHVDKFTRLFMQSIYKWVQSPLSLHIGNLDLERERALQLPVVTSSTWMKDGPPPR